VDGNKADHYAVMRNPGIAGGAYHTNRKSEYMAIAYISQHNCCKDTKRHHPDIIGFLRYFYHLCLWPVIGAPV
jgi:hypothetical protein